MIELIKALAEVKKSLEPVQKDKKGQIFKAGPSVSWSSLENIQEVVTPLLAQNGLVVTHQIEEAGTSLKTSIWHVSGESISSSYPLVTNLDQKQYGSQLTYAKRYQVLCLLDLPTTDKASGASGASGASEVGFKTYTTITPKQKETLVALAKSRGLTTPPVVQEYCREITGLATLSTVGDIPSHLYQDVMKALTALDVSSVDISTGEVLQ